MKNTFEIIAWSETCGDKFFTVAITNQEGETHTDKWSEQVLMKFVTKATRFGATFQVDEENEELVHVLSELGFIEISLEEESSTGAAVYDIYLHKFYIAANGNLEYDAAGEYLKTYKRQQAAFNFANSQKSYPVFY
jgi:hypothetical protein